jgi:hypothetical protein
MGAGPRSRDEKDADVTVGAQALEFGVRCGRAEGMPLVEVAKRDLDIGANWVDDGPDQRARPHLRHDAEKLTQVSALAAGPSANAASTAASTGKAPRACIRTDA